MRKLLSIIAIAMLVTIFSGCEKKGNPPALPPIETMKIDFSNFSATKKSAEISSAEASGKSVGNANYKFASTVARFWNSILTVNLVIPVAAFTESFNQTPVYADKKLWEWSYNVNVVGAIYKARLTGKIRDNDVKWEMYVSKEGIGAFDELLWFEGTSALDGNSGQWILYYKTDALATSPLLQIDWTRVNDTVGSVKYTYIKEDSAKDSYIEYGLTSSPLNAFYNIHLYESTYLNNFVDVFVEWSTTAHNGRVKAFYYFTDNAWHCWNESGNDTVCN